ncbi:MAG: hypothetical protein AAGH74_08285 [Pseudomonadota bacterium]
MSRWQKLSPEEFYEHPLNRLRGGLMASLAWIVFQSLFALVLLVLLLLMTEDMIDPAVPSAFEWASWVFLVSGPPLVLCLLWWRMPAAPVVYLIYFVGVWAFELIAETWAPFFLLAETYATSEGQIALMVFLGFTLGDLLVLRYLFFSERANVVLHRRIRVA